MNLSMNLSDSQVVSEGQKKRKTFTFYVDEMGSQPWWVVWFPCFFSRVPHIIQNVIIVAVEHHWVGELEMVGDSEYSEVAEVKCPPAAITPMGEQQGTQGRCQAADTCFQLGAVPLDSLALTLNTNVLLPKFMAPNKSLKEITHCQILQHNYLTIHFL